MAAAAGGAPRGPGLDGSRHPAVGRPRGAPQPAAPAARLVGVSVGVVVVLLGAIKHGDGMVAAGGRGCRRGGRLAGGSGRGTAPAVAVAGGWSGVRCWDSDRRGPRPGVGGPAAAPCVCGPGARVGAPRAAPAGVVAADGLGRHCDRRAKAPPRHCRCPPPPRRRRPGTRLLALWERVHAHTLTHWHRRCWGR
jgi:hypothetical protein